MSRCPGDSIFNLLDDEHCKHHADHREEQLERPRAQEQTTGRAIDTARAAWRSAQGSVNRNVAYSPNLVSTHIRPPCATTSPRAMYRPSPRPSTRLALTSFR